MWVRDETYSREVEVRAGKRETQTGQRVSYAQFDAQRKSERLAGLYRRVRLDCRVMHQLGGTMKAGFSHEDRNSQNVDWYTPPWVFQRLGLDFDLDPCQPPDGIDWIPAKRRYSVHDDGLTQPWSGRVWLNPPYGKHTPAWLERMHNHRNGIALVFARTDCAWFHESVAKADAILFLRGRVKFVDGLGVTGGSGAGSGSMLVAWGRENVDALLAMRDLGHLVHNAD